MEFECDPKKAERNLRKHGVSFEEAASVFNDYSMKKKTDEASDEMRPEYDLRKLKFVGRGIYAERYRSGTNLVLLDKDVRKAFPDDESVNEALRVIAKAAKHQASRAKKGPIRTQRQYTRERRHLIPTSE